MGMLLPAWAALGAATAAAAPPSVDVFTPGMRSTAGVAYSCIRIPSVVLDPPSGHLLAFAECRAWVGDGCEPAKPQGSGRGTDLCSRVSRDHGARAHHAGHQRGPADGDVRQGQEPHDPRVQLQVGAGLRQRARRELLPGLPDGHRRRRRHGAAPARPPLPISLPPSPAAPSLPPFAGRGL